MKENFAGISLDNKIIMGVLNLSSETFYEGSLVENREKAGERAEKMIENGAQIIDIGGMSTGPGVEPVSLERERDLLIPAVEEVRDRVAEPISVDTQRSEVARKALGKGADIVNDISGFKADGEMVKVGVEFDCWVILMANKVMGRLRTAEKDRRDIENMDEIVEALGESLQICKDEGIDLDKVAVDPGIGFGRSAEEDLEVLAGLERLEELGQPLCLGVSRKSFIGKTLDIENPSERLPGSLAATAVGVVKSGVDIIRTHDPAKTSQFVRMIEAIQNVEGS